MSFRRKLLTVFALTVFLSVASVALLVQYLTRGAFEKTENDRTAALVSQFQREFSRRGEEVAKRVQSIAASDSLTRMATALNGTAADSAEYFDLARVMADAHQLDFLEFLDWQGKIISSAQWPAKFGYVDNRIDALSAWGEAGPFLQLEDLEDSTAFGLFAVRTVRVGEHPVYVVGGRRLDKDFLSALDLPPDMRVLLYQNRGDHFSADLLIAPSPANAADAAHPADKLAPLIEAASKYNQEISGIVKWSSNAADDEVFHAIPLRGLGKGSTFARHSAGWEFATIVCRAEAAYSGLGAAGRRWRNRAGDPAEHLGGWPGHATGGTTGGRSAGCGGGQLEHAGGSCGERRNRAIGRVLQSDDR